MVNQQSPREKPSTVWVEVKEISSSKRDTAIRVSPRRTRLEAGGFSAQLVILPKENGSSYKLSLSLAAFGKLYTADFGIEPSGFSFDNMLHTQNIIPTGADMIQACKDGDFRRVRRLFEAGMAPGNDITDYRLKMAGPRCE